MVDTPEKYAVISGIGISRIGRKTGIPGLELSAEACREAIADAGLTPGDIDGMASLGDTPLRHVRDELGMADAALVKGGFGSAGLLTPVADGAVAVGERRRRHVLVYRTVQMVGGTMAGGGGEADDDDEAMKLLAETMGPLMGDMSPMLTHHAYSAANWLALHCRRHMHLYGTTKEQLGWLAVNSRRNAARNPRAALQDPITMDDYLGARTISSPFGLLDCDIPVDGSIAVVISHEDHAPDCPSTPLRIEALGGSDGPGAWLHRPDFPAMASTDAAAQLWSRTDLGPTDVDLAELYDGFTFLTFAWLEALGLCDEGGAGPFVEGAGRIALDGELPLNTYGGQLSAGRMHGYWVLHEACLQLRGQAEGRQVPGDPEVGVMAAGGGPIAGCLLLTR